MVATLISVFCAFGGWSLLLPVIPLAVIQNQGSESLAGLSTGIFMAATVMTQAITPWLIKRAGFAPLMAFAGLLLGLPALLYIVDMSAIPLLVISVIRGIGFGSVTVAESALIAELVPSRLIGNSSAALGTAVGLSQLSSFPLGLWLFRSYGEAAVFSTAALYAVVGALAAWWLPGRLKKTGGKSLQLYDAQPHQPQLHGAFRPRGHTSTPQEAISTQRRSTAWVRQAADLGRPALVPGLSIAASASGFAAFSTFLAPAMDTIDHAVAATVAAVGLSVLGGLQMIGRILAGRYASRRSRVGLLAPAGLALGCAGILLAGALIVTAPQGQMLLLGSLAAAGIFGFGFGIVQNEALLMLFDRLPREKTTTASALWNMSFDSGTGLGAIILGMVAGAASYHGAFWVASATILTALLIASWDTITARCVDNHAPTTAPPQSPTG